MERLTITLTPDLVASVKSAIEGGQYGSVSEVMRQALRDWEMAEARRNAELMALRADVQVGLDQIAAGKAKPFNTARIVKAGARPPATKACAKTVRRSDAWPSNRRS